jgi:hypothetical protein
MDRTESLAFAFLRSRGFNDAVYEPDGNIPPDFACGRIAVEVRRLNQHDESGRGLEVTAVPLVMKFRKLLASLGPPSTASWFVTFQYRRPVEKWRTLRPKIEAALSLFRDNPIYGIVRIPISNAFSLGIINASNLHDSCFVHGGQTDHDSGGWIASEVIRNLAIAIPEKSKKIEPFHSKYSEWWLILIDHVGYARLDAQELETLRQYIVRPPEWAKIFLVDPVRPRNAIEV